MNQLFSLGAGIFGIFGPKMLIFSISWVKPNDPLPNLIILVLKLYRTNPLIYYLWCQIGHNSVGHWVTHWAAPDAELPLSNSTVPALIAIAMFARPLSGRSARARGPPGEEHARPGRATGTAAVGVRAGTWTRRRWGAGVAKMRRRGAQAWPGGAAGSRALARGAAAVM